MSSGSDDSPVGSPVPAVEECVPEIIIEDSAPVREEVRRKRGRAVRKGVVKRLKFEDKNTTYIRKIFYVLSSLAACAGESPLQCLTSLALKLKSCKCLDLRVDVNRVFRAIQTKLSNVLATDPSWLEFMDQLEEITSYPMLSPTLPLVKVIDWVDSCYSDNADDQKGSLPSTATPVAMETVDTSMSFMTAPLVGDVVDAACSRDWMSVGEDPNRSTSLVQQRGNTCITSCSISSVSGGTKFTSSFPLGSQSHIMQIRIFPSTVQGLAKKDWWKKQVKEVILDVDPKGIGNVNEGLRQVMFGVQMELSSARQKGRVMEKSSSIGY